MLNAHIWCEGHLWWLVHMDSYAGWRYCPYSFLMAANIAYSEGYTCCQSWKWRDLAHQRWQLFFDIDGGNYYCFGWWNSHFHHCRQHLLLLWLEVFSLLSFLVANIIALTCVCFVFTLVCKLMYTINQILHIISILWLGRMRMYSIFHGALYEKWWSGV